MLTHMVEGNSPKQVLENPNAVSSSQLNLLLAEIKKRQGNAEVNLQKESLLLKRISTFSADERVLVKGTWQGPEFWSPAYLSYHVPTDCVRVWIVTGDMEVTTKTPLHFFGTTNYSAIAREVLSEKTNTSV